jgi:hypothetical protein
MMSTSGSNGDAINLLQLFFGSGGAYTVAGLDTVTSYLFTVTTRTRLGSSARLDGNAVVYCHPFVASENLF